MTDDEFRGLCNVYGFAPSRSLRELLDTATAQARIVEREACAKVCDALAKATHPNEEQVGPGSCAAAIRARGTQ